MRIIWRNRDLVVVAVTLIITAQIRTTFRLLLYLYYKFRKSILGFEYRAYLWYNIYDTGLHNYESFEIFNILVRFSFYRTKF